MLGAVPDFTVQLFEESLAALAVLFVVPNHLQVPLGGNVELVFDLLDVYVVIALDGLATCRSLLACFSGGLRVADVPLASLRALALLSPSPPPLGAELLLGVLGQVTPRLIILGSPRPTLLGLPLFLSPLLQTLLAFDFVALVAAVFLVLLDQELRFARADQCPGSPLLSEALISSLILSRSSASVCFSSLFAVSTYPPNCR